MSRGGHLSNNQTGELLSKVISKSTKSITLCHLSERCNKPHIAESTVLYHISEKFEGDITISKQTGPEFCHYIGQDEQEMMKTSV
jgi:phosphoribosyl 1,2-cyclic phosphodiesterase